MSIVHVRVYIHTSAYANSYELGEQNTGPHPLVASQLQIRLAE